MNERLRNMRLLLVCIENHLTDSATETAYVTGHDQSLTSKMTGWGTVMTGPDRSHTNKMTSWGAVCDWLGGGQ